MKSINWNLDKNQQLADERGISFEDVVVYIQQGEMIEDDFQKVKIKIDNIHG